MTAVERDELRVGIGRREVRERLGDRLTGLARRDDAAERKLGMARDEAQELAGDVAGAAEHDRRNLLSMLTPTPSRSRSEANARLQQVAELGRASHRVQCGDVRRVRMMSMPT
jgi:hypothetical protein